MSLQGSEEFPILTKMTWEIVLSPKTSLQGDTDGSPKYRQLLKKETSNSVSCERARDFSIEKHAGKTHELSSQIHK